METVSKTEDAASGLLLFLRQDNSPLSVQATSIIDSMRMTRHPAFSAYVGRLARSAVVIAILYGGLVAASTRIQTTESTNRAHIIITGGAIAVVVWLLLTINLYIHVVTTRVTIDDGRVYVEKGVFRKTLEAYDLWRLTDTQLRRTFINRLTGDGTIKLGAKNYRQLELTGIVKGKFDLEGLRKKLQDLEFALRSNPAVKGIIS
jgi:hypothetical protein